MAEITVSRIAIILRGKLLHLNIFVGYYLPLPIGSTNPMWRSCVPLARAVEALREPSDPMIRAADDRVTAGVDDSSLPTGLRHVYSAMIRVVLEGK